MAVSSSSEGVNKHSPCEDQLLPSSDDKASNSSAQPSETFTDDPLADVGTWPLWRKLKEIRIAGLCGDWQRTNTILETLPALGTSELDQLIVGVHYYVAVCSIVAGKTALDFFKKLIKYLPNSALTMTNEYGFTVLHAVAAIGNNEAAVLLVERMPELIYAVDKQGNYPVHRAAKFSQKKVLDYLVTVTKWNRNGNLNEDAEEKEKLLQLVIYVVVGGFLDIALDLVHYYPVIATINVETKKTALYHLARMTPLFNKGVDGFYTRLLRRILSVICPRIKKFVLRDNVSGPHQVARKLVRCLLSRMSCLSLEEARSIYKDAILKASLNGNKVVVQLILEEFPEAIGVQFAPGQSILHLAITNRNLSVFRFIYQSGGYKHMDLEMPDLHGNTLLHHAAKLPPPHILDHRASGPATQMQREIQWYERIKTILPYCKLEENNDNQTPYMMFTIEHKELKKDAEKWMKNTANSCCVVAVLVITIMFAATITIPGGNNPTNGFPTFKTDAPFIVFVVGDTISLLTSTFSLMVFLTTYTSHYVEDSFMFRHPKTLIKGLLALFISITFMMVTFTASIFLVLGRKRVEVLIPAAVIAGSAIVIFWVRHLRLFVELIEFTYTDGGILEFRKLKKPLL